MKSRAPFRVGSEFSSVNHFADHPSKIREKGSLKMVFESLRTSQLWWQFAASFALILALMIPPSIQNVGYIGPACAVAEDSLFLHGIFVRKLDATEQQAFYKYQGALDVLRQLHDALAMGAASISPNSSLAFGPEVPSFCNGLDGSVEVILNGCIVRKNQVFMAGRIIRSLAPVEKQKIDALIEQQKWATTTISQGPLARRRRRRQHEQQQPTQNETSSPDPLALPQHDLADLLGHFLNINASVAQRFIPMARESPLLERLNDSLMRAFSKELLAASHRNRRRKLEEEAAPADFEDDQRNEQEEDEEGDDEEFASDDGHRNNGHWQRDSPVETTDNNVTTEVVSRRNNTSASQNRNDSLLTEQLLQKERETPQKQSNIPLGAPLADSGHSIPHLIIPVDEEELLRARAWTALQPNVNNYGQQQQFQGYGQSGGSVNSAIFPSQSNQQQQYFGQYAPTTATNEQQQQQQQSPIGFQSTAPVEDSTQIRPGETVILGGQTYVAVPLSSVFPSPYGLMPTPTTGQQQSSEFVAPSTPPLFQPMMVDQQIQQHHFGSYPPTASNQQQQQQFNMPQQTPQQPAYFQQQMPGQQQQPPQGIQIPAAVVQHIISSSPYDGSAADATLPTAVSNYFAAPAAAGMTTVVESAKGNGQQQQQQDGKPQLLELPNEICQIP